MIHERIYDNRFKLQFRVYSTVTRGRNVFPLIRFELRDFRNVVIYMQPIDIVGIYRALSYVPRDERYTVANGFEDPSCTSSSMSVICAS